MKISFNQLVKDSLFHPKKLAAYRLLSIGKVIQYVFLMIAIVTALSYGQFTSNGIEAVFNFDSIRQYAEDLKWLIYPLAILILFIMNTLVIFAKISIYALAGFLLLKTMNRRGEYRQMWRTAALAITWATIFTIIFTIYPISNTFTTLLNIFVTMLFLIIAITKYPLLKRT